MAVKFFGQYLIEQKIITRSDLLRALDLQKKVNLRFGDLVIEMGMATEEQVVMIHRAQRHEDLRFGELAVKMGFLKPEQVEQALQNQRKSYLFVGEALVKLGSLTPDELEFFLEQYNQEQNFKSGQEIEIPVGFPQQQLWEILVDMHCKMLTRVAGLPFRLGVGRLTDHSPSRTLTVDAGFSGAGNARLLITLSGKIRNLLAHKVLNARADVSYPSKILDEALIQFVNLICDNAVRKASLYGYEMIMVPAQLRQSEEFQRGEDEIGLLFPIFLPEGDLMDLTLFVRR